MPPAHILNAPTKLMKELGYGAGYAYDHDGGGRLLAARTTSPTAWRGAEFYQPRDRGFEREIGKRLAYWAELRRGARA